MPSTLPLYSYTTNGWPLTTVCMWIFRAHDALNVTNSQGSLLTLWRSFCAESRLATCRRIRIKTGYTLLIDVTMQLYSQLRNSFELQAMSRQEASRLLLTRILAAAIHEVICTLDPTSSKSLIQPCSVL